MTVKVGKLRVLQLLVELGGAGLLQKIHVRPEAANCRAFRIARLNSILFLSAGMALLGGPHVLAVHFVVPPGVAEIGCDHVRPRMHVADHALAGRNRARELVANGMSGFVSRNGGIGGGGLSLISRTRRRRRNVLATDRWRRPRGRRCIRSRGSRRPDRWCREMTAADRAGASFAIPERPDRCGVRCRSRVRSV